MGLIRDGIQENSHALAAYRHAPQFVPAGQSTQMIIGATPESDRHILTLTQALYDKYKLKRVFYSAYMPVVSDRNLPARNTPPPLLREHRLYQADWLLRFYGFTAAEILDEEAPDFDPLLDPKCCWAVRHMELFPLEVNSAPYEMLLRVPGIGVKSARRIRAARRYAKLDFPDLKKTGGGAEAGPVLPHLPGKEPLPPAHGRPGGRCGGHPGGVPPSTAPSCRGKRAEGWPWTSRSSSPSSPPPRRMV